MKIKEMIEYGKKNLIKKEDAYILSKMLAKHFLKVDDTYLIINGEEEVKPFIFDFFQSAIQLLDNGMPIQYITNKQEFMELSFYVDENVLIPQPDTEILVEEVLSKINKQEKILDLCTGSGAIGIALAKNTENIKIYMSDVSEKALEIAKRNITKNKVEERCELIVSNMFENIYSKYDVIVSNPPYIESEEIKILPKEVRSEPIIALDGGFDGLDFYRIIANEAYKYLKEEGILALEIGYNQKEKVIDLLSKTGKYKDIYCNKDLGRKRESSCCDNIERNKNVICQRFKR